MSVQSRATAVASYDNRVLADLARRSRAAVLAPPILWAMIVAFSDLASQPLAILAVQGIFFAALAGLRFRLIARAPGCLADNAVRWRQVFYGFAALAAASWGAFCTFVLIAHQMDVTSMLTLLCTAGIAAGASNSLSPAPRLAIAYLLLLLVPSALALFMLGEKESVGTALMFLAYLASLIVIVRAQSTEYRNALANEAELARHVDELERARDAADAAAQAKTRFLGNISHEIRTPLNGVLGMIELVRENTRAEEDLLCLNAAYQSGERLLNLLGNIVDYVAIESDQRPGKASLFKPSELIREVAAGLSREPQHADRISTQLAEDVPFVVYGDVDCVATGLRHLASNALKFSTEAQVTIRVDLTQQPGCTADVRRIEADRENLPEVWLRFTVTDHGIGVADDVAPMLFQPFSQADSSLTRSYEGAGLGLAIVRGLVVRAGGQLGFASTKHVGSRFWFALPVHRQSNGLACLQPVADNETLAP